MKYLLKDLKHFKYMVKSIRKQYGEGFRMVDEFWRYVIAFAENELKQLHK